MKLGRMLSLLALCAALLCSCGAPQPPQSPEYTPPSQSGTQSTQGSASQSGAEDAGASGAQEAAFDFSAIPAYDGEPYAVVNGNVPYFTAEELTAESYEYYAPLDDLGRCSVTMASIGRDLMPTEPRGSIGQVKPTGWVTAKYDTVDGKYLYNRCHLIGFQLTGENANEQNLITGTRSMNTEGMLPFENMTADYIKETGNHVLYRVTPIFVEEELVARGVLMEGMSVEDQGEGILFCIYAYNNEPNIAIDYATGESRWAPEEGGKEEEGAQEQSYVLNTSSRKFHLPTCGGVKDIKASNRADFTGSRDEIVAAGYEPCGRCKP